MSKFIVITFLTASLLISCADYTNEFTTIKKDTFSVSLPDYMEECKDMVPEGNAPIQYCNRFRNLYFVVFEDEKTEPFEDYQKKATKIIKVNSGMTDVKVTDSLHVDTNGVKMNQVKIYGLMGKDNDMFYTHRTYESNNKFYQVVIWTRGKKRKLAYQEDMNKMLDSFIINQ